MTNFWLFQAVDIPVGRKKYFAEQIFEKRIKAGFWGFNPTAPNLKKLEPSDRVVFYIGGEFKHHIAGIGTVTSSVHDITEKERLDLYSEEGYSKAVSMKIERIFKPMINESKVNLSLPRLKTGRASLRVTIFPLTAKDFKRIELLQNKCE